MDWMEFDLAAIIALGAIIGRAILGDAPTLISGLLALSTLLILQALTGMACHFHRIAGIVNSPAVVRIAGSELLIGEDPLHGVIGTERVAWKG